MVTLFNVPVKRIFVVALVVLMGCKDSDKNSSLIFEALNESLERPNEVISDLTKAVLFDLEGKTRALETAEQALVWFSAADSIFSKSEYLVSFLEGLKSNLKQNQIEIGPRTSNELYKKLMIFKDEISKGNSDFKSQYNINAAILDEEIKGESEFYKINFLGKGISEKSTALLRIENNILVVTNNIITYCNHKVSGFRCVIVERFEAIASANSTVLKRGQEMIIQAGVGVFSLRGNPSFEINGVAIQPNENGIGEYKLKIRNKPGDYKIRVKVRYRNPSGGQEILQKDIEYTVIDVLPGDKQTQVSADYIGVEMDTTMSP